MSDRSAVCTLFEGHYHYGVAALVNSLYQQGYRGDVYAGYRGLLPNWADLPAAPDSIGWPDARSVQVADGLLLHFLPLDTTYHFTNFKPDFMLLLWEGVAQHASQLFYFDPDIVLMAPWSFYQRWAGCGVALCEDVNSPLTEHHPRRVAWRQYFGAAGFTLRFRNSIYVNGGFVGTESKAFLTLWRQMQEAMALRIGGLSRSSVGDTPMLTPEGEPFDPFGKTDQDALNATVEAWDGPVSYLGKEAMAFEAGTILMPHALGQPKPWQWPYLGQALRGLPPRLVDRAYWAAANALIQSQPAGAVRLKKTTLGLAAIIGRFYRRGSV